MEHKPRDVSVPSCNDFIMPPEMYKQLLQSHNTYIDATTAVAIEGLHPQALKANIVVDNEQVPISEYLLQKNKKLSQWNAQTTLKEKRNGFQYAGKEAPR